MALKAWHTVVTPREDLREGKPLDAAEFAVHLDHVRDGRAPKDYQDPERFFERTFLTKGLTDMAAEVVRRLSGEKTQTSAVFNMTTQFGGGKTHALTLLYHLTTVGEEARKFSGVPAILEKAGISRVPEAVSAVFVGTEFDSITGRGGKDGTPLRKTPWGEIAFQLGGKESFSVVKEHEEQMIAPSGEVIRSMLPQGKPCIILMDELMNYINRFRRMGMGNQLYSFLQNLSEVVRGEDQAVLVVSIPASELEMTAEDQADYDRFKKLLDRVGKPVVMSAGTETSEIIRRRLFEWDGMPEEGRKAIREYIKWVINYRQQIPGDFPVDRAQGQFEATYPFHPSVLSVFERKWQTLPRFQQTRGILRLLALWISLTYRRGFTEGRKDPLIDLGSAPLDDPMFRTAVFEQLGENRLEAAVTTDIAGKGDSHATRLDEDASDAIGKARLHQKVATSIFFESSGGQKSLVATLPEIRFAVGRPEIDVANIETVLEALSPPNGACFHLDSSQNRYWFSVKPNLVKVHVDRLATVKPEKVQEKVLAEIQRVFQTKSELKPEFFPERNNQIPDRPSLSLVVLPPERSLQDPHTSEFIQSILMEYGTSARTFKSALLFAVPEGDTLLKKEARKGIAWEEIQDEQEISGFDELQKGQIANHIRAAQRDVKEAVWKTYRYVILLGKDNKLQTINLGPINSGSGPSLGLVILERLKQDDIVALDVSPNFLVRRWPPAIQKWTTKAVRDMFFASPLFPRLINPDVLRDTIARGVSTGLIAYAGEPSPGNFNPFYFGEAVNASDIEISEDVFILTSEDAERFKKPRKLVSIKIIPDAASLKPGESVKFSVQGIDDQFETMPVEHVTWTATGGKVSGDGMFIADPREGSFSVTASHQGQIASALVKISTTPLPVKKSELSWRGTILPQKWMNFYTKVLSRFATKKGLTITVDITLEEEHGISDQLIEETKTALKEIGLVDNLTVKEIENS